MEINRRTYPWWGLVFFAIGVLAVVGTLVSLFFTLGRRPAEIWATERPPVTSEAFLLALSGAVNSPVREGGRAELLSNGVEILPALLEAANGAQKSINWMVYIWEPGQMSDALFDVLTQRARAGVEVRLMLDGFGGQNAPRKRIRELQEAGGRVVIFRPLSPGVLTRFHKRNHRRAIVIDGEIGFTGGAAVGDAWLGNAENPDRWRDDMVRVTGPLARSLQAAFEQLWSGTSGEILVGPRFYPTRPDVGSQGERISRHLNIVSSPSDEYYPIRKLYWMSFAGARQRIWITNPYFVPDDEVRKVLMERARAGIDVRVLTVSEHTDVAPLRWAAQHYYEPLLAAGVRIYEYQPTMIHSKNLVVDSVWSVVGSANLDIRSKELNQENVLSILDASFAGELEHAFLADLERSREIRLPEWRRRGMWPRLRERGSVLFEEQF